MPNRWCVFDGKTEYNETLLMKDFDSACMDSDCSTFGSGATCDHLVFAEKVSYAYNMRYQMNNQDQEYCELLGAELTANNPSTPDCEFPVEILTAEVVDGGSPDTKKYQIRASASTCLYDLNNNCVSLFISFFICFVALVSY